MGDECVCWLDSFCRPITNAEQLKYLQSIITNPGHGEDATQYGLWERVVVYELGEYAHNFLTRCLRHAIWVFKDPLPLVRMFFFCLIGLVHGLRVIITKQLERAGDTERLEYFTNTFVPYVRSSQIALIEQPFDLKNTMRLVVTFVSVLQMAWLTQTVSGWTLQSEHEALAKKEAAYIVAHNRANKQAAKEALRRAPKDAKKPRRRGGLNSHRLAPIEETNASVPLP